MHDRRAESFESQLASAFDRMGPSEEAERRMLASLQTANRHRASRRRPTPRIAVAVAACFALLAGIGALSLNAFFDGIDEPLGNSAARSADNLASPLSADRAQSESAAVPDGDVRYPFVTLSSGEQLRVAIGDDGPLTADESSVGAEIEQAVAANPLEQTTAPCTVFESDDPAHPYVVRYDDDGSAYLADRIDL